jgi:hypothetical protein
MTDVLDIIGLGAVTAAGFLFAPAVGVLVLGCACLFVSWRMTRRGRS